MVRFPVIRRAVGIRRAASSLCLAVIAATVGALAVGSSAAAALTPPTVTNPPVAGGTYATTDRQPTFGGTAVAGETIKVVIDGSSILTTTAAANGTWGVAVPSSSALAVATHSVAVTACEDGGCSLPTSFSLIELPDTPTISAPVPGSSTTDRTPTLTGAADGGDQVSVYLDGSSTPLGTVTATASGSWELTETGALSLGSHTISAIATDPVSGLESAASGADSFRVVPSATVTPGINIDQDVTLTFDGGFRSRCSLTPQKIKSCAVTAYVGRQQIAYGIRKLAGRGAHTTIVTSKLNATGRRLLGSSGTGGLHVNLEMKLVAAGGSIFKVNGRTIAYLPFAKLAFTVHFPFAKATLSQSAIRTIISEAKKLKGESVVLCDGNTDSIGTWKYNYALGIRRGKAVCSLLRKLGIRTRVGVHSYSYDYPVASNDTAAGRALNRRTAVWVTFASSF